jgi:membrane protein
MSDHDAEQSSQKRLTREPQGPAYPRTGGMTATLKRTFAEFKEDQLTDRAAALTYYGVLSIFPALIALVSIIGLVGNPQKVIDAATKVISSIGPASAVQTFKGPIDSLASSSGAGIALIVGVVAAVWTASGYVGAFIRASNVIYETPEGRSFLILRPLQMLVTLILVVLQALVLAALVLSGPVADQVGSVIGASSTVVNVWNIAKWPVIVLIVLLMFCLLYFSAPNAKLAGVRSVVPGAVFALLIWVVASALFAFYLAHFGSYNKTYGTLAGIIVGLVWLWLTNVAILFGAELNAERERSREIDRSTPGAERKIQLKARTEPAPGKRSRTA